MHGMLGRHLRAYLGPIDLLELLSGHVQCISSVELRPVRRRHLL